MLGDSCEKSSSNGQNVGHPLGYVLHQVPVARCYVDVVYAVVEDELYGAIFYLVPSVYFSIFVFSFEIYQQAVQSLNGYFPSSSAASRANHASTFAGISSGCLTIFIYGYPPTSFWLSIIRPSRARNSCIIRLLIASRSFGRAPAFCTT